MREITIHKAIDGDRQPDVFAHEDVQPGGAPQVYEIFYGQGIDRYKEVLQFISLDAEGVSNEALLAIVIDRLERFQAGKFACEENADALDSAKQALSWLRIRTLQRVKRGVEGKAEE